MSVCGGF